MKTYDDVKSEFLSAKKSILESTEIKSFADGLSTCDIKTLDTKNGIPLCIQESWSYTYTSDKSVVLTLFVYNDNGTFERIDRTEFYNEV